MLLRVILVLMLTILQVLAVPVVLFPAISVSLMAWSFAYGRKMHCYLRHPYPPIGYAC